ncbi:MAG: hypothetical protein RTU30_05315 [Candidatus Thorarchaeota archaeon]
MTAETLAMVAGLILTLVFSYIPGLNTKFAALSAEVKRLIMLGLLVLVAAVSLGIACAGAGEVFGVAIVCDETGIYALIKVLVAAIVVNQGTFMISPRTPAVRAVNGE